MSFIADARCPACAWKLNKRIKTYGNVRQQIDIANGVVDPILAGHLEQHPSIKKMLLEAGEAPLLPGMSATYSFRGLFELEYKEVKD